MANFEDYTFYLTMSQKVYTAIFSKIIKERQSKKAMMPVHFEITIKSMRSKSLFYVTALFLSLLFLIIY